MKTLITIIRSVVAPAGVAGRNFLSAQFMKTNFKLLQTRIYCAVALGIGSPFGLAAAPENSADTAPATTVIPWSQLGAKAGINPAFSDANWSSMGGIAGTDGEVLAAVVDGSGNLYIGGSFSVAGDVIANRVAKWNGTSWSALGSGMGGGIGGYTVVSALAVLGSDLYAGGGFTMAGGKVSAYIARAYLPALPTLSVLRFGESVTVSWPAVDTTGFALEQAALLAAPVGWVTNSAALTDDGTKKSVTLPATNISQFFRLRRP